MKEFIIEVSQNSWEYTGYITINCNEIVKLDDETIMADGVTIKFDEDFNILKESDE